MCIFSPHHFSMIVAQCYQIRMLHVEYMNVKYTLPQPSRAARLGPTHVRPNKYLKTINQSELNRDPVREPADCYMIGERGREYAFGVKEEDSRDSSSLYLTVIFLPALLSVTTTIIRVLFCSSIVINLSAYIRSQGLFLCSQNLSLVPLQLS